MTESNTNLDIIYYLLTSPGDGIEAVRKKNFFFLALFIATLSVLSSFTGDNLILPTALIPGNLSLSFLIKLLLFYFLLFVTALLYNFIAELFGRRERASLLLILLGLSFLPGIFNVPLALICKGLNLGNIYGILKLLPMFWTIGLQVFFLQKMYALSLFRAMIIYISPLLLIFFLSFSFILIILTFFALNLSRLLM